MGTLNQLRVIQFSIFRGALPAMFRRAGTQVISIQAIASRVAWDPASRVAWNPVSLGRVSWIIGDVRTIDPFRHIVVIMAEFRQFGGIDQGWASPVARVEPAWMLSGSIELRSVVAMFDRLLLRCRQRSKKHGLVAWEPAS
jgi:hypothetical protein